MEMQIDEQSDVLTLRLAGSFDELATDWFEMVGSRMTKMPSDVLLNLSEVTYIDSKGLGALFDLHKRVEELGHHMYFCELSEEVFEVFELAGLQHIFRLYDEEDAAREAIHLGRVGRGGAAR